MYIKVTYRYAHRLKVSRSGGVFRDIRTCMARYGFRQTDADYSWKEGERTLVFEGGDKRGDQRTPFLQKEDMPPGETTHDEEAKDGKGD
jgi:hypothetical protein